MSRYGSPPSYHDNDDDVCSGGGSTWPVRAARRPKKPSLVKGTSICARASYKHVTNRFVNRVPHLCDLARALVLLLLAVRRRTSTAQCPHEERTKRRWSVVMKSDTAVNACAHAEAPSSAFPFLLSRHACAMNDKTCPFASLRLVLLCLLFIILWWARHKMVQSLFFIIGPPSQPRPPSCSILLSPHCCGLGSKFFILTRFFFPPPSPFPSNSRIKTYLFISFIMLLFVSFYLMLFSI